MYNFDEQIDRAGTDCIKYDAMDLIYDHDDLLPFWIADMDFKTPQPIIEAMKKRLDHPVIGYSKWNTDHFYDAVKHWYQTRFNAKVMNSDVHYAPTVLFTITEVIRTLTHSGDGIIINTPSYNNFINLIEGNKRTIIEAPLIDNGLNYTMDMEYFESLCKKPENKIFLLCNPHNPTGKVFTKEELDTVVEICAAHDVFIIADEIHMDFVRHPDGHQTLVNWMKPDSPIIVVTCLGKTFNISGLPHSFYITKHRYLTLDLNRKLISVYGLGSTNPLINCAVQAAYMECADWVDEVNQYIEENMQMVKQFVDDELSDALDVRIPDATFLMWIDFSKSGHDEQTVQQALQHIGKIAVGIGSTYEIGESTHFRLNLACDRERLKEGLSRMKQAFDSLSVEAKKVSSK
ncbi:MalY/PatB family protein [Macrococcus lamae]|uniref:cysteine-S-conjugate beta-lyase n=1 Tax=Macrococcus lamae TaxID=198484 RepID=A0A4R6BT92_9STAP|nr:PatB family C-S lyase [Macrococcus lamae]TDM07671.1 putative C-S lyase [Macrococcus lamae]